MAKPGRKPGPDGVAGVAISVRFTQALVDRIDAYIAALEGRTPGIHLSRSDVLRIAAEHLMKDAEMAPPMKKVSGGRR